MKFRFWITPLQTEIFRKERARFTLLISLFFLLLAGVSCGTKKHAQNFYRSTNFIPFGTTEFVTFNTVGDTAILTISLTNRKRIDGMVYRKFQSHISFPKPPTDTFFQDLAGFSGSGYLRSEGSKTYFLPEHYKLFRSRKATEYIKENYGSECMWHDWEQPEGARWRFMGVLPFADGSVRVEKVRVENGRTYMRLRFSNGGPLHHLPYVRYAELTKGIGLTSLSIWHPMLGKYLHFERR